MPFFFSSASHISRTASSRPFSSSSCSPLAAVAVNT
jgi:hypothetical protein